MGLMTIGQVAQRAGVRPSAIRYYEARGILRPAVRSAHEYRLYGAETLAVLCFVRRARELGFSLTEIRQIIEVSGREPVCGRTRELIARHLVQVEQELRRLRSLRARLKRLLERPVPETGGGVCPLIEGEGSAISIRLQARQMNDPIR